MADTLKIIRSLEQISTGYTVFEQDQVLTEKQLNGLASYLDDQDRLTRVELLGVGIIGGLRVQMAGNMVKVSKGVGVTTDGDLLLLPADGTFDRIKPYDETAPAYPPFYPLPAGTMIKVFELVRQGESDVRAQAMSTLPGKLTDMVVVMMMESYQKDQDLCSGTDCDNLGKDAVNTTRLLLVSKDDAGALLKPLAADNVASLQLPELLADRPQISGAITTTGALATLYRNACSNIQTSLVNSLGLLYANLPGLIGDLFSGDPSAAWIARLNAIKSGFASQDLGIQYYYDFLKDVVETWNALRDTLLDDDSVLCPDVTVYSKHLLLGELSNPSQLRTGLYPSPLTSRGGNYARDHACFLANKLNVQINTFAVPTAASLPVLITPSRDESAALEHRAIPYYYAVRSDFPIHRGWNFWLSMRGAEGRNLGYSAAAYGGSAITLNPFGSQIGCYDFFRIEGHLGQNVTTMINQLNGLIAAKNLPIAVRGILLHTDPTLIIIKPPIRYGDLHRFHYLLRKEVDTQLDRSSTFSQSFKNEVQDAVTRGDVPVRMDDSDTAKAAADFDTAIRGAISQSRNTLTSASYKQYRSDTSWKTQYTLAVDSIGKLKQNFGHMMRNDFSTAFDTVIADNHLQWIDWLDSLIDAKDKQEDNKLLFQNFIKEHAGLEHFAGVVRGGTFVLVYDNKAQVVADFMLPYYAPEIAADEPPQPTLPVIPYKPAYVYTGGFKLVQPIDVMFTAKLADLRTTVQGDWKKDVSVQQDYLKFFTSTVGALGSIGANKNIRAGDLAAQFKDPQLGLTMTAIDNFTRQADAARAALMQPSLPDDTRKTIAMQLTQTETLLANAIGSAAQYIATSKVDVSAGTEGSTVLSAMSAGMDKVSSPAALRVLRSGLRKAQGNASGAQQLAMSNLIQMKGLGG